MNSDIEVELKAAMERAISPLVKDINRYKMQLADKEAYISQLLSEIADLRHNHEDSGLKRDQPMNCKYKLYPITKGQFAGQTETQWFCPSCRMSVSNWETYCISCGQRLNRKYLPELEVMDDDWIGGD